MSAAIGGHLEGADFPRGVVKASCLNSFSVRWSSTSGNSRVLSENGGTRPGLSFAFGANGANVFPCASPFVSV